MSQRHHIAVVAAASTLLAAFPLTTVFASWTWLLYSALAIAAIVGSAMAVRTMRGPVPAQFGAMLLALLLFLTLLFPSGGEFARLIPTPATFENFGLLLNEAGNQIRNETIPVQAEDGLLLLSTAGIGLVAVLVDLLAVGLRRPALAGLPMLAIYSVPVAVLPKSISFIAFAAGAVGYLWLLVTDSVDRVRRFGRRFTGEGRDVDLWEPSPLAATGRRLGLIGVVVALLVPLALPGITSGLLDDLRRTGGGTGPGGGPGGNEVNLFADLTGKLNRDRQFEMVRVTTNDPSPYYLRFGVADVIGPGGFSNRTPAGSISLGQAFDDVQPVEGVPSERFRATVQAVDFGMPLAPMYLQPTAVRGLGGGWFYDPSTSQVHSRGNRSVNGTAYEFDYTRYQFSDEMLRTADPLPTDSPLRALTQVPPVEQVQRQVAELVTGKTTQYDQVRAIYDFFTASGSGFTYNLSTVGGTSGNDIVDFLTTKKGFCVQYAAAMAWLVREAGFPSRVAFGFTRGPTASGGTMILSNTNLHAWTEVYFPKFGWVPFDATPSSSIVGSVTQQWAPGPTISSGPSGPIDQGPDRNTPEPSFGPSGPGDDNPGDTGSGGGSALDNAKVPLSLGVGGLMILLALFAPAMRRRTLRRGRRSRSGPTLEMVRGPDGPAPPDQARSDLVLHEAAMPAARADAHAAWAEVLDTMIDYDLPVDNAETPRATATRIARLPGMAPEANEHVVLLARAEERARYALAPLRTDGLDPALRQLRRAIGERATRRERLVALLMPKSVTQRWRRTWYTVFHRSVNTVGRRRDRIVAVLSPRRLLRTSR